MGYTDVLQPESFQFTRSKPVKQKLAASDPESFVPVELEVPSDPTFHVETMRQVHNGPSGTLDDQLSLLQQFLSSGDVWIVLIEICTSYDSGFAPQHLKKFHGCRRFVIQITQELDIMQCHGQLVSAIRNLKARHEFVIATWLSPPCCDDLSGEVLISRTTWYTSYLSPTIQTHQIPQNTWLFNMTVGMLNNFVESLWIPELLFESITPLTSSHLVACHLSRICFPLSTTMYQLKVHDLKIWKVQQLGTTCSTFRVFSSTEGCTFHRLCRTNG